MKKEISNQLKKVLKDNFPIDYLIFSSGAGVYDWKKQTLMHSQYLPDFEVKQISKILIEHQVDFMIHEIIPDNHKFIYFRTEIHNPDFERRINVYKDFAIELNLKTENYSNACQIIAVFPNNLALMPEGYASHVTHSQLIHVARYHYASTA